MDDEKIEVTMTDVADVGLVEIEITRDARVYVNVDGICRFRAYRPKAIMLTVNGKSRSINTESWQKENNDAH